VFVGTAAAIDLMATLWSVPAAGGEAAPLLEGFDRTVMVGGGPAYPGAPPRIGPGGRSILFCARDRGCVHVYELPLEGGAPVRRLGDDDVVVSGVSAAGGVIAAAVGTSEHPPDVVALEAGEERRLTFVNDELLAGVTVVRPERRTFTAADGCAVEALVYLPPDAGGPAPLLMDIHGGPHNAIGPVLWPAHLAWQELAGRGWCVVAPNPRGSDGYGLRFMEGVRGAWGVADMQDFVAAVDGLVADGVADPDRLAVTGYSYGGFMTGWLVGHTDRFRRAAAGGVVSDLVSAYGTSDEGAYLGRLAVGDELHEAWDAFDARSPIRSAGSIETPLLILHGERDDRCDIGQAEQLFATLRRRRREVELVRYPGASHTFIVSGRPSHRADYQRRVVDWVTRDGAEGDAR
jgi:dipeptidyl aminopeptidase/acylaminoacyl peptidase